MMGPVWSATNDKRNSEPDRHGSRRRRHLLVSRYGEARSGLAELHSRRRLRSLARQWSARARVPPITTVLGRNESESLRVHRNGRTAPKPPSPQGVRLEPRCVSRGFLFWRG